MTGIDPAAVKAAHEPTFDEGDGWWCPSCHEWAVEQFCEPYRLAEALAASEAKVARVETLRLETGHPTWEDLDAALADQFT